MSTDSISVLPH